MEEKSRKSGTLNSDYFYARKTKWSHRYRLKRRTSEVLRGIKEFAPSEPSSILDLGTADALMLARIHEEYPNAKAYGIEYSDDLVALAQDAFPDLIVKQGDIQDLSMFADTTFDVVTLAAVIEHVANPDLVLKEVYRVLSQNGLLILTAPDPFWEHVATMVGHLDDDQHHEVMNLKQLQKKLSNVGLKIRKAEKFMFSPIGFPFERAIEKVFRFVHLNGLMANQIVVGQK